MTIFAATTHTNGGVVWSDTESYIGGQVYSRSATKIHLAPLANCIGFGNGALALCRAAGSMMNEAEDFDEIVGKLPSFMLYKSSEYERLFDSFEVECRDLEFPHLSTVCVLGWSKIFQQWLIASFCSQVGFVPSLHRQFSAPFIHHDISDDRHSIESDAAWQMREIQQKIPDATGGVLVVARVSGSGLSCEVKQIFQGSVVKIACSAADCGAGGGNLDAPPAGSF